MANVAQELGAVDKVVTLEKIAEYLIRMTNKKNMTGNNKLVLMQLITHYQQLCDKGQIQADPCQIDALSQFQRVYDDLMHAYHQRKALFSRLRKRPVVKGLYLWGSVGTGKTFLMDVFFQDLPFQKKLRLHFHAFMQYIHHELKRYEGRQDPISAIATSLAKQYRVICFDEFVVTDIVDAMILRNLLEELFSQGVCFVATSNTVPEDLYKNGLQRTSFIPVIALMKKNMEVMKITSTQDYRLRQLHQSGVFFEPCDEKSHAEMEKIFSLLAHDADVSVEPIFLHGRSIEILKRTDKLAWFYFHDICQIPRSQNDYLSIVKNFKTVFISGIPIFNASDKNTVSLFIRLIDVLYDARVPIVVSAAAPILEISRSLSHVTDYARTESRLQEMQSEKYFSQQMLNG